MGGKGLLRGTWLDWDSVWLVVAGASVFLVRASLGYRPFPSIDDFAYVPLALHWLDPSLYPRDTLLQMFANHELAYGALVALGDATFGLVTTFFVVTLVLTVLSVVAMGRVMRELGANGLLLPLALALSASVIVRGLGRGSYDGLIGDAVHGQWMAIVLSLFSFDALLRRRDFVCGAMLGLASYAQPMLAFHSAFAIAVAGMWQGRTGLVSTARVALTAGLVAAPLAVILLPHVLTGAVPQHGGGFDLLRDGYLFRLPHHYVLDLYDVALMSLITVTGASALARFADLGTVRDRRAAGLYLGLVLVFAASVLLYATESGKAFGHHELIAYILDLTRSSPLLMAMAGVFVAVAVEKALTGEPGTGKGGFWGVVTWVTTLVCVVFLVFLNMRRDSWTLGALLLSLVTALAYRRSVDPRIIAVAWLAAGGVAAFSFASNVGLRAEPPPGEAQLYSWVRSHTATSALFIIPPGLTEFRLRTKRSVYVDFKLMSVAQPDQVREWRRRLGLVAQPDGLALAARGWPAMQEWDRTYAARNTPARILSLLKATGADYFVFNEAGLNVPPFVDRDRRLVPGLTIAYRNARYAVYRRTAEEKRFGIRNPRPTGQRIPVDLPSTRPTRR